MPTGMKFRPTATDNISLDAVTTGTGTPIAMQDCRQISWTVKGAGTVSGGTLKIECADTQDYSGTWQELDSLDLSSPVLSDSLYQSTYPGSVGGFFRGRVSSDVTGGGTVTVSFNGLKP